MSDSDMTLGYIQIQPLGTLRWTLYGVYPKGVNLYKGATLYVARINKDGQLKMARPCDVCYQELVQLRFKRIVYTTDDGLVETEDL